MTISINSDAIVNYARHKHIDLIVTGTRGRNKLTSAFLGSVASDVITSAHPKSNRVTEYYDSTQSTATVRSFADYYNDDNNNDSSKVTGKYGCPPKPVMIRSERKEES